MMKIDSVSSNPDRAGRYLIRFDDGSTMHLYRQTIQDFSLYVGAELTEEQKAALDIAAGAMSAKMRAVRIVSATSVSKQELERRLIQKGENADHAHQAVAWMCEHSLVDDRRTAEQIVERCISKGYGISRAKQALYEKRIPKQYWDEVLVEYPDQMGAIISFLRGKLLEDYQPRDLHRVMEALIRRGHSYSDIRRGLEQLSLDTDDFPEET